MLPSSAAVHETARTRYIASKREAATHDSNGVYANTHDTRRGNIKAHHDAFS